MGTVMDTGGQGCIGMDVDMEGDSKESGWIDGSHREGMTTSQTYPPFSHRTQAHVYHNHSQPHRPYRPGNNNNLSQAHSSTSSPGGSIGGGDSSRHRSHSLHKPSSPHKNISPPTAILKQRRTPNYDAEPYWIEGMMMDAGGEGAYMTPCHSPGSVGTTNSRRSVKSVRSGGGEGDVDMVSVRFSCLLNLPQKTQTKSVPIVSRNSTDFLDIPQNTQPCFIRSLSENWWQVFPASDVRTEGQVHDGTTS